MCSADRTRRRTARRAAGPLACVCAAGLSLSLALLCPPAGAAQAITPEQVASAVTAVAADPALGGTRTERELRLKDEPKPDQPAPRTSPDAWRWLLDLVSWIAAGGRWIVFLVAATAIGMVVVYLRRWIQAKGDAEGLAAPAQPTHVRDLDIRPESLPADIAAAARALWLGGEQRAALSLLYRGALSQLVHRHALPIRAASTEGECARLAAARLPPKAAACFERIVAAWLPAVYGGRMPASEQVLALCGEFDAQWPVVRR